MNCLKMAVIKILRGFLLYYFLFLSTNSLAQQDTSQTILVGGSKEMIYDVSVIDTEIVFTLLFNKVLKDTNEVFKIKIFDTNEELAQKVKEGKVDAIFSNMLQFIKLRDYLNFAATYAVQNGPLLRPCYYLLVQKNSGITSLDQLRDKRIIISKGHAAGELYLDVKLLKQQLPIKEAFFDSVDYSHESNSAIVKLFFDKTDAVLVSDFTFDIANELNPQIGQKIKILSRSKPMVNVVIAYHKDFLQSRIDSFEPRIWGLHTNPDVIHIMEKFRYQGLKRLNEKDIEQVQFLTNEYSRLTGVE